jgi:hypothetical protein
VASYSQNELKLIADFFQKFTAVWERGRQQLEQADNKK